MKRAAQPDGKDQLQQRRQRTEPLFVLIGTDEVPLGTTELDLSGKGLTALPESIGKLQALETLNLTGNELKELPAAIGSLAALTELDMSDNQLTELPAAIGSLAALMRLNVSGNQLKELPAAIGSLTALKVLDVSNNQLKELPVAIGRLAALTELDVNNNQLTELPAAIFSLAALTTLEVRSNKLKELPDAIGSLAALTELRAGSNKLTELPAAIGSLTKLTDLVVNHNQLTELPAAIGSLASLTTLDVYGNQLKKLPAAIGSLARLTTLWVNGNQLTELPPEIGSLTALTTLYVGDNQLTELPTAIGSLTKLTMLRVGSNQLTELPAEIGRLTALTDLDVGNNQLTELPATIGKLIALRQLDLCINELTELPLEIGSLTMEGVTRCCDGPYSDTNLHVEHNPLQLPPLAVARRGSAAIRAYFEDLRAGTAVARTCMLVLLGDGEMGKTSLLNGLRNDCVPKPAPAGVDGRTIHMAIKPLPLGAGDSEVKFRCYDLGGQYKSYAAAQQAYVARGALYLLVVSAEAATSAAHEERLRWWLHFLQTNAPGAVVQPVLTHADKCTSEAQAAERAAWVVGVCQGHLDRVNALPVGSPSPLSIQLDHIPRVDAATGEGAATLSAVRDRLLALAWQPKLLPIVGQTIPKLWEPAMECVRAVRSGANCTAAASMALLDTRPPSPVSVDSGGRPLLYELVATLKEKWEEVAEELMGALNEMGAPSLEVDEEFEALVREGEKEGKDQILVDEEPAITELRLRKAAFSSLSQCHSILASAQQLMADQGEIFLSGDIAYLDPATITTSLIAPLVDHRINDVDTYLSVGGPGEDLYTYVSQSTPNTNPQPKFMAMRAALQELASPRALLDLDLLSFLWRDQDYQDEHLRMLCDAGLLLHLSDTDKYVMPLRLETTAPSGLDAAWPVTPHKDEWHIRHIYKWDNAGFVPPGLCEKMVAAFQGVAGCRYLRDDSCGALVWQRGALFKLGRATVKLEVVVVVKESDDLQLQLVAHARGTDEGSVRALLETGDVYTTLSSVLAGFPGLWMPLEAVAKPIAIQEKRMCSAVAVTVGNRYSGSQSVDCNRSAEHLHDALQERGLRVEAPWIDEPGGLPMLEKLRQVLRSKVLQTDDGFVLCLCGHGNATEFVGNDNVRTSYQAIIHVIDTEIKLIGADTSILLVADCCQIVTSAGVDQIQLPKNMILARSTGFRTEAFEQVGLGNVYSNRLAANIRSHAAAHSVEHLLKLTQGEVHEASTPAPQIAHVGSALGAFHLFLGPAPKY